MAEEEKVEQVETEQKKKKSFIDWYKEHPKTVFTIRFILWTACAAALPFAFIAWRYDIFTPASKIKLTGWGFIAIIIPVWNEHTGGKITPDPAAGPPDT